MPRLLAVAALAAASCAHASRAALPSVPDEPRGPFGGGELVFHSPTVRVPVLPVESMGEAERRAFRALHDGDESFETMLQAALYVSGYGDDSLRDAADKLVRRKVDAARRELSSIRDPVEKARGLLAFLHREVFRRYEAEQTYPAAAVATGVFDCVSSAIVYDLFAAALGLKTEGVMIPSHAYSAVVVNGRRYEVQTTVAGGFDQHMSRAELEAFVREHRLRHGAGTEKPAFVSNARLFSLALENRLSMQHDGAVDGRSESLLRAQLALTERLNVLAPEEKQYRHNLVAALQQLADRERDGGRAALAFRTTEAALEAAGRAQDPTLLAEARHNVIAFTQSWMRAVLATDHAPDAADVAAEAARLLGCPNASECTELWQMARAELWAKAKTLVDGNAARAAFRIAERVDLSGGDDADRQNFVFFAASAADETWTAGDRTGAEDLVSKAIARFDCRRFGAQCSSLAGAIAGQWFDVDEVKARSWAAKAYAFDRSDKVARANFLATTQNAVRHAIEIHDCEAARRFTEELAAENFHDGTLEEAARECE